MESIVEAEIPEPEPEAGGQVIGNLGAGREPRNILVKPYPEVDKLDGRPLKPGVVLDRIIGEEERIVAVDKKREGVLAETPGAILTQEFHAGAGFYDPRQSLLRPVIPFDDGAGGSRGDIL